MRQEMTAASIFGEEEEVSPFKTLSDVDQRRKEQQELIDRAKTKYDRNFFLKFAYTGKNSQYLTQKSLEEYILKESDPE